MTRPTTTTTFPLIYLLTSSLLSVSSAYICFPPPGPLPFFRDCRTLITGILSLSHQPFENIAKHWGRHLPTTAHSEQLPRWYYIAGESPPNTCEVVVDVADDASYVGTFPLRNVAVAAEIAFYECMVGKGQIGLEFPTEEGHVFVKIYLSDTPAAARRVGRGREGGRRVKLPDGNVLVVVGGAGLVEDAVGGNRTES